MTDTTIDLDVLVIGGGIAGLWTLERLRHHGYRAILLQDGALGGAQTSASQGMIHGGIKYALAGVGTGAAQAIAAMPEAWSRALAGREGPDLRAARVLSRESFLWTRSALRGLVASAVLRGQAQELAAHAYPAALAGSDFSGKVYRLADPVIDVPSMIAALAATQHGALFAIDWRHARFTRGTDRAVTGIAVDCGGQMLGLRARRIVLCAGAGNEALLEQLGAGRPRMQRRPLHQVLLKHPSLTPLYGHCIGRGATPRLTVSSHRHRDGEWIWYLGGELAERGTARDQDAQIRCAQHELSEQFPGLELQGAAWRTLRVDRAEPRQPRRLRPDDAWLGAATGAPAVLAGWPTKLALAPRFAALVLEALADLEPSGSALPGEIARFLDAPLRAAPVWSELYP